MISKMDILILIAIIKEIVLLTEYNNDNNDRNRTQCIYLRGKKELRLFVASLFLTMMNMVEVSKLRLYFRTSKNYKRSKNKRVDKYSNDAINMCLFISRVKTLV